jgi:hypothetical protein
LPKDKIVAKIYHQNGEILLAACDKILIGKYFEEGELQLQVHEKFYSDFQVDEEDFVQHLKNSTIANLVGETVIRCAQDAGYLSEECIIHIQGIPHAQIYRIVS